MQRFQRGDLVQIAADLGPSMSHFPADQQAIVTGSYADLYGGSGERTPSYQLFLRGAGRTSWYYEPQLTLRDASRLDLLAKWEEEVQLRRAREADLDWVFSHGQEVLAKPAAASVGALAGCLGVREADLWGSHGEGITYLLRATQILTLAAPFLSSNDRAGWAAMCSAAKEAPDA